MVAFGQSTEPSPLLSGWGEVMSDHFVPFQRSMRKLRPSPPTAKHEWPLGHETSLINAYFAPSSDCGSRTPSQRSAKPPAGPAPTTVQASMSLHETPYAESVPSDSMLHIVPSQIAT